MNKRIKHVVPETQQEIATTIEEGEDGFVVDIRACPPLDDELRSEFHDRVRSLGTNSISVSSRTGKSNQGNETGQDVTVRFDHEDKLTAIDVVNNVIQIGKEIYERQLERNLSREEEKDSNWKHINQQRYFDDEDVKEFCLLYRGKVGI